MKRFVRPTLIALAWTMLYLDVIQRLAGDWAVDENYSHGFLLPFVSAYAVWSRREELRSAPAAGQTAAGLSLMALALVLLFAGILGAELYATRLSLLVSLSALVVYFLGFRALRLMLFPIGLMLLAVPIPSIIFNQVAFPMQLAASDLAASAIRALGIPALREGNLIELPRLKLQVVEACSGIRSLVALISLAAVYGYFLEPSRLKRVILLLSAFPVAVLANAVRVALTAVVADRRGPAAAEGFLHAFSGALVFAVAAAIIFLLHGLLKLPSRGRSKRREEPA